MQLRRKCFRYANSKLVDLAVLERNNRTITTVNRLREIDASIKNTLMTLCCCMEIWRKSVNGTVK
jgi:hypothetical protein